MVSSPAEPVYYMYTFPVGVDTVVVTAVSDDTKCMTLSIQTVKVISGWDFFVDELFHSCNGLELFSKDFALKVYISIKFSRLSCYFVGRYCLWTDEILFFTSICRACSWASSLELVLKGYLHLVKGISNQYSYMYLFLNILFIIKWHLFFPP